MTHGLRPTGHSTGGEILVKGLSVASILSRLGGTGAYGSSWVAL